MFLKVFIMIEFPVINNITDVLPYIEGRDEFSVVDKGSYTVINYNVMFTDTFLHPEEIGIPSEEKITRQIRRECRGIMFDSVTGNIIRRPFHKFKNVNEAPETQADRIDMSKPHVILEKLDGSMISAFYANGELIWGTKMGATDVAKPVEEFVKNNPNYVEFAKDAICMNFTPIFEWCSRKQRIVLDYPEDQLILTGLRWMSHGEYCKRDEMIDWAEGYNIPVVRAFEPQTDMKEFIEYTRDLENLEGFVVCFDDGHMLKLKCNWYLQLHRAKEAIQQDRNIVEMILDEHLDDLKPNLSAEDRDRINQFEHDFNSAIHKVAMEIVSIHAALKESGVDRKTFATEQAPNLDSYIRPIVFTIFDETTTPNVLPLVHNMIRKCLTRIAKYEEIRETWFPNVKHNE